MSLLEDVFLQDEAGEAQELERIIEGDEYDDRPRQSASNSDDDSEKEGEAEEDKRRVDPTSAKPKRVVKNPRFILNPARLTGPRGIQVIPEHFKDFKFKGKGHEKEDLDLVLKKLEHWAYRLYPKFQFEDCLKKIESLGKKRPVMVHLHKIRTDQFISEDTVVQRDSSDDETTPAPVQEEDEFDRLLQQQIELARATPAPSSVKKPAFSTPMVDKSASMPKATSSPSINEEQRERMLRNRQLAEERRLARLKQSTTESNETMAQEPLRSPDKSNEKTDNDNKNPILGNRETVISEDIDREKIARVQNRSNVIDSSDEDEVVMNKSVSVDVHDSNRNDSDMDFDNDNINTRNDADEIPKAKSNISNVVDSSDEDEVVMNKSVPVDVYNSNRNDSDMDSDSDNDNIKNGNDADEIPKAKNHRSNVIDSSDEEDILVVNESVTVDIHDNHRNEIKDSDNDSHNKDSDNKLQIVESNDIEMNGTDSTALEKLDFESQTIENESVEKLDNKDGHSDNNSDKSNKNININEINSQNSKCFDSENDSSEVSNQNIGINNHSVSNSNLDNEPQNEYNEKSPVDKDDKEKMTVLDEVMDVDFSEEF